VGKKEKNKKRRHRNNVKACGKLARPFSNPI